MKLLIDDADILKIEKCCESYPVDGVTTNPSILARAGESPYPLLKRIRGIIGVDAQLHVQLVSVNSEAMLEEARRIVKELGESCYIKIPAVSEGFKAMRSLSADGFHVTGTAIYTPMQALMAAKCGAECIAAYVNRIDNTGVDGVQTVRDISKIYKNYGINTEIIAASFKNVRQVFELCLDGVDAVTLPPQLFNDISASLNASVAVDDFKKEFERCFGKGISMLNA